MDTRKAIANRLLSEDKPVSGTALSSEFSVSRQIIVKDIGVLKDKGYDITYNINTSLFAPKGVPQEIVTLLQDAVEQTLNDSEVKAEFEKASLQLQYGNAELAEQAVNEETEKVRAVLKELDLIE